MIGKQGRNAILYYDKAFSYAKTYRILKDNEVWPKWISTYFFIGGTHSSSPWPIFASLMYYFDNQFDKADKIWSTVGKDINWSGLLSTSIIKKDYKKALIYTNNMVEAKYTPNSLAKRANLHKEMRNYTAYNNDKKEAEKLCQNDTKCLDNVAKVSENYIKEQVELYHFNRKRLGFE